MYTIYILRCNNGSLYTGITNNLEKRLLVHRKGLGSKYVRAHLPFNLVYKENIDTKSEALKREYEIKQMPKEQKELLIISK